MLSKLWRLLWILLPVVFFVFLIFLGFNRGKLTAQSQVVYQNAASLKKALGFFYYDNEHYPKELEFKDPRLMALYLSPFPPKEFMSQRCSQSFLYRRIQPAVFQLQYCLPVAVENNQAGWNEFALKNE